VTYEQDPRESPDLLRKPAAVVIRGIRVRAVEPGRPTEARGRAGRNPRDRPTDGGPDLRRRRSVLKMESSGRT